MRLRHSLFSWDARTLPQTNPTNSGKRDNREHTFYSFSLLIDNVHVIEIMFKPLYSQADLRTVPYLGPLFNESTNLRDPGEPVSRPGSLHAVAHRPDRPIIVLAQCVRQNTQGPPADSQ